MKAKILGFLVTFLMGSVVVWAASTTSILNMPFTDNAGINSALRTLDLKVGRALRERQTRDQIFCGQLANSGTLYNGPCDATSDIGTGTDCSIGGVACDALDNATEATADAPIHTNVPLNVYGMVCRVSSSGSNGVAITLRSGAADTSPVLTCTVPTGSVECVDSVGTGEAVPIAAGATMDVKTVTTEDLSAQDVLCLVNYAMSDINN